MFHLGFCRLFQGRRRQICSLPSRPRPSSLPSLIQNPRTECAGVLVRPMSLGMFKKAGLWLRDLGDNIDSIGKSHRCVEAASPPCSEKHKNGEKGDPWTGRFTLNFGDNAQPVSVPPIPVVEGLCIEYGAGAPSLPFPICPHPIHWHRGIASRFHSPVQCYSGYQILWPLPCDT